MKRKTKAQLFSYIRNVCPDLVRVVSDLKNGILDGKLVAFKSDIILYADNAQVLVKKGDRAMLSDGRLLFVWPYHRNCIINVYIKGNVNDTFSYIVQDAHQKTISLMDGKPTIEDVRGIVFVHEGFLSAPCLVGREKTNQL